MTGLIAPVIPATSTTTSLRSGSSIASRTVRTMPLAGLQMPTAGPVDVVYGMGRLDSSGRVADQVIPRVLRWHSGDRLTVTGTPEVITAHRDPAGMVTLGRKPYITIPAVLRDRCGLRAGDRVLLAATPADNTLTVYPLITVHQAIRGLPTQAGESR
ncbi:hypothetical protein GCM10029964_060300 [Kibdelosporangium lantanae]